MTKEIKSKNKVVYPFSDKVS